MLLQHPSLPPSRQHLLTHTPAQLAPPSAHTHTTCSTSTSRSCCSGYGLPLYVAGPRRLIKWARAAILDTLHAMCAHPAVNNGSLESSMQALNCCVRKMHAYSSVCTLIAAAKGSLHNTPRRPQPHNRVHWTTGASAHMRMPDSPQRQNTRNAKSSCRVGCMNAANAPQTASRLPWRLPTHEVSTCAASTTHTGAQSQRLLGLLWKKGTVASCGSLCAFSQLQRRPKAWSECPLPVRPSQTCTTWRVLSHLQLQAGPDHTIASWVYRSRV